MWVQSWYGFSIDQAFSNPLFFGILLGGGICYCEHICWSFAVVVVVKVSETTLSDKIYKCLRVDLGNKEHINKILSLKTKWNWLPAKLVFEPNRYVGLDSFINTNHAMGRFNIQQNDDIFPRK